MPLKTVLILTLSLVLLLPSADGQENDAKVPAAEAEARSSISALIKDLADDDVRGNALAAGRELRSLGLLAAPELEKALDSSDDQQRHCAAQSLRYLVHKYSYPLSDKLLEITVDGLRDDHLHGSINTDNARSGRRFLARHAKAASTFLVRALDSDDRQQRFISAHVLAHNHPPSDIERVCEILIKHLEDNDVKTDAMLSCKALYTLGQRAVPYLGAKQDSLDRQQREAVALILLDIRQPPLNGEERLARHRLHSLSEYFEDPCFTCGSWWEDLGEHQYWRILRRARKGGFIPKLTDLHRIYDYDQLEYKAESWESNHAIIAVGIIRGTQFDRQITLRVHADGRIERRATGKTGEHRWILVCSE